MVLITGVIKNTDGSPYVGSVKFALNNLGIESNTVYLPTVVTVDSDGIVTVDLWPNTNSLTSTYYKCSLDNGSVFNVSIPGNNPSYNLGDVILIDPGTLDPGIIRRLNLIEDIIDAGIAIRIGDLENYTGIADNRIPDTAISGEYPYMVAGTAIKVSKILTLGDGLSGGSYRGDTDVTVSVDGTVIRATDTRLSDAREWVAQTAPIEVVSQPANNTRYAWTPQRIWDTIVSWFSTITSDDVQEGGSNLYYTDTRVSNNPDVQTNTTKVSATGSVTTHNDITSSGSGQIITTSERTKLGNIEDNAQVNTVNSVAGKTGDVVLDSNDVGLGNVPNIDTSNASNITSGTLSGSRLSYGTEANTPAQGNDARFTDSREWTASTVSQSVAQNGTDTTRHAWTSQRVRDNVAAYTLPYTLAEKSKLAGLNSADYLPVEGTAENSQLWDGWLRTTYLDQAVTTTSIPNFNGIHIYDDSNLEPSGNIRVGRAPSQYITFTGGPAGNIITSVSTDTNPKPLYINIKKGDVYTNYVFDDDTLTIPGSINAAGGTFTGNFQVNGNTFFVDESTGRVGIGTDSPAAKLNVNDSLGAQDPTQPQESMALFVSYNRTDNGQFVNRGVAFGAFNYATAIISRDRSNNPMPLIINPLGGNLGVGVSHPNDKLDVGGNIRASGNIRAAEGTFTGDVTLGDTSGSNNSKIEIFGGATSNDFSAINVTKRYPRIQFVDNGSGDASFQFWFLVDQMRFGSDASNQTRAAMYITTGVGSNSAVVVNGQLRLNNLPTSPNGLATGQVWNDSGTLKIV